MGKFLGSYLEYIVLLSGKSFLDLYEIYVPLQATSDKVDMGDHFFRYGRQETDYLKRKDKRMAELIERVGMVRRPVIPDLFEALVHSIVGQQISTKAHATVWARLQQRLGTVDALSVLSLSPELGAFLPKNSLHPIYSGKSLEWSSGLSLPLRAVGC